jgi:hypothetical protein
MSIHHRKKHSQVMPNGKKDERVTVRLSADERAKLAEVAKKADLDESEILRLGGMALVESYLRTGKINLPVKIN